MTEKKKNGAATGRREQILQQLVTMLAEPDFDAKVSTAKLARGLGVSEATLYRHFRSKAEMFDGIIDFIQDSLLGLARQVQEREDLKARDQVRMLALLFLNFVEANPGLARLLTGEALMYEDPALKERILKVYGSYEACIKQSLRLGMMKGDVPHSDNITVRSQAVQSYLIGQCLRFTLTSFKLSPRTGAEDTLSMLLA